MQNPARVDLLRRRLGLSKIAFARALGIDRRTIQRFESGVSELSDPPLRRICELSGYPVSFVYKGDFDYPNPDGVSFRSLRSLTAARRDAALAAGALAFELDDWINERFDLPEHNLPKVNNQSPTTAASALRSYWGIGERPIGNMINVLETHGVRVFSLTEETRQLDAYSFWRNDRPYVFLNTLKTPEHGRFDAAHELGHLVMHCHTGAGRKSAEDEAHAFASAFLMPPADLLAQMPIVTSFRELVEGKRRWRVSVAALNYALHRLGVISDWRYRSYCIEMSKLGREYEPNGIEAETSQVWVKILKDLWHDGITASHIAEQLAIPERELSNILFGIAASPAGRGVAGPLRVVQNAI